jgi:hypothetical protein
MVWVIGYGAVQASAPGLFRRPSAGEPTGRTATTLAFALAAFPALIAVTLSSSLDASAVIVVGLIPIRRRFRTQLRGALVPHPPPRRRRQGRPMTLAISLLLELTAVERRVATSLRRELLAIGSRLRLSSTRTVRSLKQVRTTP